MIVQRIPLADWGNGVIMIGVFVLVVIILVGFLIYYMGGGSSKKKDASEK